MQQLQRHYRVCILQDLLLAALAVFFGAILLRMGFAPSVVIGSVGITVIFLVVYIAIYVFNFRRSLAQRRAAAHDPNWSHWRYHADEWRRLHDNSHFRQHLRAQSGQWSTSLKQNGVLSGVLIGGCFAFFLRDYGWQGLFGAVLVGGGICALMLRSAWRIERSAKDPYPWKDQQDTDVFISAQGVIYPVGSITFGRPNLQIVQAAIEMHDPAVLHIGLEYSRGQGHKLPYDVFVPIPEGHEAEAEAIVQRIKMLPIQLEQLKLS